MSPHHLHNKKDYCQTNCLPRTWCQLSSLFESSKCPPKSEESNLPYRFAIQFAENVHIFSNCPALQNKSNPVVSIIDCKHHLEEFIIYVNIIFYFFCSRKFFTVVICSKN